MELRHVLRLAKKWFWVIIIAILIGGAAGLVVNLFQPKMYEATTILYVSAPNHSDYQGVLGAQQAAKAFASLPTSDDVLKATLHTVNVPGLSLSQLYLEMNELTVISMRSLHPDHTQEKREAPIL